MVREKQILNFAFLFFITFLIGCEHRLPYPAFQNGPPRQPGELRIEDFPVPESCAGCHPNHYAEWRGSMHAYAVTDPVFSAMQTLGWRETEKKMDQFCIQCHSPVASRLGFTPPFYDEASLPPVGRRGVSCAVCHSITEVKQPANADVRFEPLAGFHGPISDPAENSFHASQFAPMFTTSELCSGCHNVVNPRGVNIENTFNEWESSPAAAEGKQCQDCHMPAYEGPAAVGGPQRTVHRHFFVGVDVALVDFPERERQREMVEALLRSAAEMTVEAPDSAVAGDRFLLPVRITSKTAGHALPTGAVADRQLWLWVQVKDASGRVIYQSGHFDANGDLMDRHSEIAPNGDFDLVEFGQLMYGAQGEDVFFSWQAWGERTKTIPPLATVAPIYVIPVPAEAIGPLQVQVKLRFRSFPPFILRKVGLGDLVAKVPVIDMCEWSGQIPLFSP